MGQRPGEERRGPGGPAGLANESVGDALSVQPLELLGQCLPPVDFASDFVDVTDVAVAVASRAAAQPINAASPKVSLGGNPSELTEPAKHTTQPT